MVMDGGAMTETTVSEFAVERIGARGQQDINDRRTANTAPKRSHAKADYVQYRGHLRSKVAPTLFGGATVAVLWLGWINRDDNGLTPESGIGYWLGITGGSLMLLLLLYPLRKRIKSLRAVGSVGFWFRSHMILGVIGPVLILWHANFRLGSLNSNVALAAMLVVAVSGVVGRYLYGKIHLGLYGRKAEVKEILADADALKAAIGVDLPVADRLVEHLGAFAKLGTAAPSSAAAGLLRIPVVSLRASVVRMRLIAEARQAIAIEGKRLGLS